MKKTILLLALLSLVACQRNTDDPPPKVQREYVKGDRKTDVRTATDDWYVKDPTVDGLEGVRSEKAIKDFGLAHERQVIVAVIDSGIDVKHEDLQGKIWVNAGETGVDANGKDKSSNGVDDDKNGYVDDINGWNFLGGADGRHIEHETLEMTREMVAYEKRQAAGESFTAAEAAYFETVKKAYNEELESTQADMKIYAPVAAKVKAAKDILIAKLNQTDYSEAALKGIVSADADVNSAKTDLLQVIKDYQTVERFERILESAQNTLDYYLNKSYNPRADIVKDNPNDFSDTKYGNNSVQGPDALHGTHVAGIIGAIRGNGKGADGVAENVKIMVLRAVPDGDERDKDIALAVRYAVDNGATLINMSFGKAFSPSKSRVDEAFLYASSKGVLLFHAAGNSAHNNDLGGNFPSQTVLDAVVKNLPETIPTWIEVGASAKLKDLKMAANFSNYGKKKVDLFSPGVGLLASIPDNQYAVLSGTSMASPAACGTGALLMSNFKGMTAAQAKAILLREVRLYPGLEVRLPGSAKLDLPVPFDSLSVTGGVIDAYESIALAKQLAK